MSLFKIQNIKFRDANEFVRLHHRHSKPVVGWKFGLSVVVGEEITAVGIVGRPVARLLDDGKTLEITRLCLKDGSPKNVASFLIGKLAREARKHGAKKLITYILATELGTSLKSANMKHVGTTKKRTPKGGWANRPGREYSKVAYIDKKRFELSL